MIGIGHRKIEHVAVLVGRPSRRFLHAAIAFRASDRSLKAIHLTLSGEVERGSLYGECLDGYAWAEPKVNPDWLAMIAAHCESILMRPGPVKFNYAFAYLKSTVLTDDGTSMRIEGETVGLTCATFVLAMFDYHKLTLLDLDSWKFREDDAKWQRSIFETYLKGKATDWGLDKSVLERIEKEISVPCLRFRPEEVFASCLVGDHPAKFDPTVKYAEWVVYQIDNNGSLHPLPDLASLDKKSGCMLPLALFNYTS